MSELKRDYQSATEPCIRHPISARSGRAEILTKSATEVTFKDQTNPTRNALAGPSSEQNGLSSRVPCPASTSVSQSVQSKHLPQTRLETKAYGRQVKGGHVRDAKADFESIRSASSQFVIPDTHAPETAETRVLNVEILEEIGRIVERLRERIASRKKRRRPR